MDSLFFRFPPCRDHMDSYFIAETVKYLYLLFDEGDVSADFR